MRVIAGTYRSRPLTAPRGLATRPTSDRLRETLFNVLAPHIEGARFADFYAGSGAVGIEALSRGAAHVTFVESAAPAVAALRSNLAALGIREGFQTEQRSVPLAFTSTRPGKTRPPTRKL
jgi:16S rRNA (guanine(966)-N(2))-methyltransferase RsmD